MMRIRLLVITLTLATASSVSAEPIGFWQFIEHPGDMTNIVQTGDAGTMYLDFDFSWPSTGQIWDGHKATFGFPAGTVALSRGMVQTTPNQFDGSVDLLIAFSSTLSGPLSDPTPDCCVPGPRIFAGSTLLDLSSIEAGDTLHLGWDQTLFLLGEQWHSVFTFNGTIASNFGGGTGHGTLVLTSVPEPSVLYLTVLGLVTTSTLRRIRRCVA
jgi:hypothetical protein